MTTDYLIIGAGLGGLVCGAILAREGNSVHIIEKEPQPGGLLQSFGFGNLQFDTGLHYAGGLDKGRSLYRYFRYLGIADQLDLHRLDVNGFDKVFVDGTWYPLAMGFENFVEQLLPHFPAEKQSLITYVQTLKDIAASFPLYNMALPDDADRELKYRRSGAFNFLESLTTNNTLRAVLAGNNFLYAGARESTPMYQPALINHSYISGAYRFPKGGNQIIGLLSGKIKDGGGIIQCGQEAVSIKKKSGVFEISTREGTTFRASNIISAIHPAKTLALTDPALFRPAYRDRILNLENTISAFGVYAILKKNSFSYMNHNCYVSAGKDPVNGKWPGSYFLQTPVSETQGLYADRVEILTFMHWDAVPAGNKEQYDEFKRESAERLLRKAEEQFPGLRSCISDYTVATPHTWEKFTGSPGGSLYGIKKDFHHPVETMVFPRTKVPGFYFTGQNINLHGLPGTTIGAVMTCGEILGMEPLLKKIKDASE
jgi:all-trans-retinol 13,14-reductase